ncbi:MAG: T9SS type A sorting domain-containing protein, partial [Bacteroidales bacterium]|nr:T9SS type A sorting domain-containing protein [Bacteroidales bacterium]
WHSSFGSNTYEYGSYIIETSNGNILTGGDTWVTHSNNTRWYLLKTDTAGNIIWERTFGRSNYNNGHVQGIIETTDSNYLACGSYPVARYGGGGGEYLWDGCLRKIDTDGNLIWERLYRNYSKYSTGGDESIRMKESFSGIYQDHEKYVYLISNTYDNNPFFRGSLIKLNSKGDIVFKRLYYAIDQYSNEQWLVSLQPTSDRGFILAGYGNAYDWYGYNPPQQAWLVKTDSLGIDGLCYTEPPELNIDIVLPAIVNCSDTITVYAYIAGKSAPYTIETSVGQLIDSIYYPPTFVPVEIGLTHVNLQWDNSTYFEETITEATLSNHEWGQCIAKPVEFYTPHTSGTQQINITVTDAYGESKTITKEVFAVQCSTHNDADVLEQIKLYPNPVKDKLNINIPQSRNFSYAEIYDSKGQLLLTHKLITGTNTINTNNLLPGTYIVKFSNKDGYNESNVFEKIE